MRTFIDLVCVTATSSGTGPFVLGAHVTGFFGTEKLQDGQIYTYSVQQDDNKEAGFGMWIAGSNTLTRTPYSSSNSNTPVAFSVGAEVGFTFGSQDILDLLAEAGGVGATAKAAFNAYGLQWGVWFNATPGASELLALYVCPIVMQFPGNFAEASTAPPLTPPAASWSATVDRQTGGTGGWENIGAITIATDGTVSLTTVGSAPIDIAIGDRLRVLAPAGADTALAGFAVTLRGYIP